MARVLTTAAGSDIGVGAIQSLQKASHEVIAVDMNPNSAGLYMADEGAVVPPADADNWPSKIMNIVSEFNIDVIIPLIDQELQNIPRLRRNITDSTPILVPKSELIDKTIDKKEMYEFFESKGLRIPETVCLNKIDDLSDLNPEWFPRIVKPRSGQGSKGVRIVESPSELQEYIRNSDYNAGEILVQELIGGAEYTSNITVTMDNELLSIVNKEVPVREGYTALGITRKTPMVKQACKRAFESLTPAGPINVQHMLDESGNPYIIEINPRFSGSSCLTVEAGVNEFDLLVRSALGEDVNPPQDYQTGLSMIRYTDQLYIDEESLLK